MSRTHKKCLITSGALHVLLLIILLVTPAFLAKNKPNVDQTVLTLVSTEVAAQPPAQQPQPTPQPPQPEPKPEPEKPAPRPPEPEPEPEPVKPKPIKPKPEPKKEVVKKPEVKPTPKPKIEYTKAEDIKFDKPVKRASQQPQPTRIDEDALRDVLKPKESTQLTKTDLAPLPTISGYSGDTYSSVVRNAYYRNWNPPSNVTTKSKTVTVRVVIRKDGTVKSAVVLKKSGSAALNASITKLINKQVTKMPQPFPANARDTERTYDLEFNLNLKFNG